MSGHIRIGTSGWVYPHWRHRFYPKGVSQESWLSYYADTFDTVEVNNTFYRLPRAATMTRWRETVPEGFSFAVKASRYITHVKQLHDADEPVRRFLRLANTLGDSLGPVLWQLPPTFQRDDERLRRFTGSLPAHYSHAMEFRHSSWQAEGVLDILRAANVAWCIPNRSPGRSYRAVTANFVYVRFHRGSRSGEYTPDTLRRWAGEIDGWRSEGLQVWIYFNNDQEGFAVTNALQLRRRLCE